MLKLTVALNCCALHQFPPELKSRLAGNVPLHFIGQRLHSTDRWLSAGVSLHDGLAPDLAQEGLAGGQSEWYEDCPMECTNYLGDTRCEWSMVARPINA